MRKVLLDYLWLVVMVALVVVWFALLAHYGTFDDPSCVGPGC